MFLLYRNCEFYKKCGGFEDFNRDILGLFFVEFTARRRKKYDVNEIERNDLSFI